MTAAVDTELDAQTIAELDAIGHCEWHGPEHAPEQCERPAAYVLRFTLPCGDKGMTLLCPGHLGELLNWKTWRCSRCDVKGPARLLDWRLL